VKEVVDKTRPSHNDSLFLNAGDEFQVGTLIMHFYRLSYIRGREVMLLYSNWAWATYIAKS
jgi:hypothetical protein